MNVTLTSVNQPCLFKKQNQGTQNLAPRLLVLPGDGHVQLYDGRYSQVCPPAPLIEATM